MRKMKLDLGSIEVQSFPTAEAAPGRGTVEAHQITFENCTAFCRETIQATCDCTPNTRCTCEPEQCTQIFNCN